MSTLRKRSSIVPSTILPELTAEEVPAPKIPTVVEERMVGSRARPLVMHPDGRLRSKRT